MIRLYNEKDELIKTLSVYEYNEADMGESSITVELRFSTPQDFHPDWYLLKDGEKFFLGVRKPTGKKDTSSLSTIYTLVFKSERENLKRFTFMDFVELGSNNPQPSTYRVSLYCTLTQMVDRFNINLQHYLGSRWVMTLPDGYAESGTMVSVVFDNASLWDVLLQFYELFGVRWNIVSGEDALNIQVGYEAVEIEHIFEYGAGNGLVSVERNNALERIVTRLRGRGSERNLPPTYFHTGDPDTNDILQTVYYPNLMPKVYRDYVRGYNAGTGEDTWAYNEGVADKVAGKPMAPIDYVISANEALWGISYGAIDPNDKIFPTLQGATRDGVRLDEVIKVEQVLVDGVKEAIRTQAVDLGYASYQTVSGRVGTVTGKHYLPDCRELQEGQIGSSSGFTIENPINTLKLRFNIVNISYTDKTGESYVATLGDDTDIFASVQLQILDVSGAVPSVVLTSDTISNQETYLWELQNLPLGEYTVIAKYQWKAGVYEEEDDKGDIINPHYLTGCVVFMRFEISSLMVYEYKREEDKNDFKETFDIWIRDVWNIARNEGESDEDYAYRVWSPLAVTEEMTVMFSDGYLAAEDYEFRVVGFSSDSDNLEQIITTAIKPVSDVEGAAWKLTLQKSEAELEASNKYIPNTMVNAQAGDHFFFINIAMPYDPYVYDAEARLDSYLLDELALLDEEFPSFTINPSRIFCKDFAEVDKIKVGTKIRLANVALIGDDYITLYIQSLTKRYTANSLNPEWTVTISDKVIVSGSPVDLLQGEVREISKHVDVNESSIQEAVKRLQSLFLRKDGSKEISKSETTFEKSVTLGDSVQDIDFRKGELSGQGFGVYTDSDGNRVIEADILVGRVGARFNEVVINQATYSGGKQVFSAAGLVIDRVEEVGDVYRCYFDTKNGTLTNLFAVDDGAFCQRFTNDGYRTYWRRVVTIGPDYVDLSLSDCMEGSAEPLAGDNIAQLGNRTDTTRQAAFIIDEVRDGGGLVSWYDDITGYTLSEKDSINIGRIDGKTWLQVYGSAYIGARDESEYVKYENGKVSIKGSLEVGTKLGDKDLEQMIAEATPDGYDEFVEQVVGDLASLQRQIDGAIESYFYEYEPTLENYPASGWSTDEEKAAHLNDTFTNLSDGRSWRWTVSDSVYGWTEITDTATTKALEIAGKAQDTADGKRRVFITQPTPPYDLGDLWAGGSDVPLRRCINSKASGSFDASDWDYADNTQSQIAGLDYLKKALKESTLIEGGLIQSSILALGYTDDNGVFHIMSGTSGIYDTTQKGNGIAAWYGGAMVDKEVDTDATDFAKTLFRHDGSGYIAGTNISWDKDGIVSFAKEIKIGGGEDTLGSVLNSIATIKRDYLPLTGGTISGILRVQGALVIPTTAPEGIDEGEWAFYLDESGTGAEVPSGGSGVDEEELWAILATDDSSNIIHSSHIPTLGISKVSGLRAELDAKVNASVLASVATSGKYSDLSGTPTSLKNPTSLSWSGYSSGSYDGSSAKSFVIPTSLPASDVYSWAKASSKPSYTTTEVSEGSNLYFTNARAVSACDGTYLKLSGGTIDGNLGLTGHIATRGHYLFVRDNDNADWIVTDWNWQHEYTLIHSGNIGSQSVSYATNAGYSDRLVSPYSYEGGTYINNDTTPESLFGSSYTFSAMMENCAAFGGYASVLNFTGYQQYGGTQLAVYYNNTTPRMALRNFTQTSWKFTDWREIAFTDSNVASATKLQTARSIWGQSFDGTGDVSGDISMTVAGTNFGVGPRIGFYIQDRGQVAEIRGVYDNIDWSSSNPAAGSLRFYTASYASPTEKMRITSGGNVLIGTTTDNGYKLDVNGSFRASNVVLTNAEHNYCGLMPNNAITTSGDYRDLWLYNNHALKLYGSSIELHNNTSILGDIEATGLVIPTAPPSNPQSGKWYFYLA